MKKNLLIAAILGIAFVACKKDKTCTCEVSEVSRISTQPGFTYSPQPSTKSITTYKEVKKGNHNLDDCISTDHVYTYNDPAYTGTVLTNYVVTVTQKNTCTLD